MDQKLKKLENYKLIMQANLVLKIFIIVKLSFLEMLNLRENWKNI